MFGGYKGLVFFILTPLNGQLDFKSLLVIGRGAKLLRAKGEPLIPSRNTALPTF